MALERTEAQIPLHVLLVDDHGFVATVLESMLASVPDVTLHWCEHGADAVTKATALDPAVILQDLVMPGIDGFTLVRQYRENRATAATPIIVLSGNDDAETKARAQLAGADDFMVKLPTRETLVAAVRRHARRTRAAAGATEPAVVRDAIGGASSGFMDALFDQFLREATSRVATLRDAADRRDADTLRRTAHNLKGSASIVGAQRLAALCAGIEDRLGTTVPDLPSPVMLADIDAELARVREALAERGGAQ